MKILRLFVVFVTLLFTGVLAPSPARAEDPVSFDFFYDSLAPYGEWIEVGDYGLCWRPNDVDPDWTPYSDGYWAYTDAGWTWVSYEDFGGIVYHYGRWIRLEDDSWCWTPDYEWAPAWVAWRSNDDYVGWAPLPPEARWEHDRGIGIWVDRVCDIGPGYYSFCRVRDFGAPVLRGVIIGRGQNVAIIRGTVNVTNITYNTGYSGGPVIFNGGPNFDAINRFSERRIPALKLVQNANFDSAHWRDHRGPGGRHGFNSQTVGNQLIVTAPRITPPANPAAFKSQAGKVIAADKVSHGWGLVKNAEVQKELRQEINRQSKGLTPATAPARAVAAADLNGVPQKADPNAAPVSGEKRDRPGKGPHPESVVVQPTNPPSIVPTAPVATPSSSPNTPDGVVRERGRMRNSPPPNAPAVGGPNLKPFNPDSNPPRSPNAPTAAFTPLPRGPVSTEINPPDRSAEQARIRAEQQRIIQQKQAEAAAQQQQKQAGAAAEQQKQMSAQQEAARAKAIEMRRREIIEQPQQQPRQPQNLPPQPPQPPSQQQRQVQPPQPPPQQQQQQQRGAELHRAEDAARARQQSEPQRSIQPPPQPQSTNQTPPAGPTHPAGGRSSKDSKDGKDKDKNGN